MLKYLINFLKFCLFISFGLGILYYLYYNLNTDYQAQCALDGVAAADCSLMAKIITDFKSANIFWVFMVFLAFTLSNVSRMIRWGMLMRNMGYPIRNGIVYMSIILGYFFNLFFPRLGEFVRAGTIAKYDEVPMEKVVGTIVVDRTMDVLCLALVMALAFAVEYDNLMNFINANRPADGPGMFSQTWFSVFILGSIAIAGILWKFRKNLQSTKFGQKISGIFKGLWEGIQTIFTLKKPILFILHSLNVWLMYFLMAYLCFFAFDPTAHLGLRAGLTVFAFSALGVLIPSPGGMGTVHWLTIQALALYGVGKFAAFSFANILFFSIQIFYNIIGGIICLVILYFLNKKTPLTNNSDISDVPDQKAEI